jgi:photosystem II stability/assembly factor-like uncharacterized protein
MKNTQTAFRTEQNLGQHNTTQHNTNLKIIILSLISFLFISGANIAQSSQSERNYIASQIAKSTDSYNKISSRAKNYFNQLTEVTETDEDEKLEEQFEMWNYYWSTRCYFPDCKAGGDVEGAKAYATNLANTYTGCANNINTSTPWQSEGPWKNASGFCNLGIVNAVETDPNNPSIIYAGTETGGLFKTTNGGSTWVNLTDNLKISALCVRDIAIDPNNTNRLIIGTGEGVSKQPTTGVFESWDGGTTWKLANFNGTINSIGFRACRFIGNYIFVGNGNKIWRRPNDGLYSAFNNSALWQPMQMNVDINQIGYNTTCLASGILIDRFVNNIEVDLMNPSYMYAGVGSYPSINNTPLLRSTDGGASWNQLNLPAGALSGELVSVDVTTADPNRIFIFYEQISLSPCHVPTPTAPVYSNLYTIASSTNQGTSWTILNSTLNSIVNFSTFVEKSNGWWQALPGFEMSDLNTSEFVIGGAVLMKGLLGANNTCTYSEVTGYTSNSNNPNTHADIRDNIEVHSSGGTQTLTLACDGGIIRSTDFGQTWSNLNGTSGLNISQFYSVSSFNKNNNLLCTFMHDGPKLGIGANWDVTFKFGNGHTYEEHAEGGWTGPENVLNSGMIYSNPGKEVFVSFNSGKNKYSLINSAFTDGFTSKLFEIPSDPYSIIAGEETGSGIFKYTALPNSLQAVGSSTIEFNSNNLDYALVPSDPNLSNVCLVSIAPTNSNVMIKIHNGTGTISASNKIFITNNLNSSQTFTDITANISILNQWGGQNIIKIDREVTWVMFDPMNEKRIFISFSGYGYMHNGKGKVLKSENGGQTWTDISNGLPPYPVNHMVYQNGTNDIIYAATDVGVFKYNKTSNIWECFNEGMAPAIATKVEINYCRKKLYVSTYGRGAYSCNLPQAPDYHITPALVNAINGTSVNNPTITVPNNYYMQFANDVVVDANVYMNQKGMLFFNPDHGFVVGKQANVVLTGTMTTACPQLWKGIQVNGDANANQNYSGGFAINQGILQVLNGGTIKNAMIGVCNYTNQSNGNPDFGSTGGVITSYYATFLNNAKDVDLIDYNFPANRSKFWYSTFETDDKLLGNVSISDHVKIKQVNDVGFYACYFLYNAGNNYPVGQRGFGIHAYNAKFNAQGACANSASCTLSQKSKFTNLDWGIVADNTNPLQTNIVSDCVFSNIYQVGVFEKNVNFVTIRNNDFNLGGLNSTYNGVSGAYMANSRYYKIENNNFKFNPNLNNPALTNNGTYGVVSNNCYDGTHSIYRNNFNNLYRGVGAFYSNAIPSSGVLNNSLGLKIRCNQFGNTNGNSNDIIILGNNGSVDGIQGDYNLTAPNLKTLVGNRYYSSCSGSNKWNFAVNAPWSVHKNNNDGICKVDPQPNCSSNPQIQLSNIPIGYSSIQQCLDNFTVSTKVRSNSEIATLKEKLASSQQTVDATLDGGDKAVLLSFLNSGSTLSAKTNSLLALSPMLSDEALTAYFNLNGVSNANYLSVHNANKPVSYAVWQILLGKNFTGTVQSTLDEQQSADPFNERYSIISENQNNRYNLMDAYSDKICNFLNDTLESSRDSALANITYANIPDGKCQLIAQRVHTPGNNITANEIDQLHGGSNNVDEFCYFEKTMILLNNHAKNWNCLRTNENLKAIIEAIANNENHKAKHLARAVLSYVYGTEWEVEYLDIESQGGRAAIATETETKSSTGEIINLKLEGVDKLIIFPNPATNLVYLVFSKSHQDKKYTFKFCNSINISLLQGAIDQNKINEIQTNNLARGIYMLQIFEGEKMINTQKIILND